jgi:hypothetical protein
MCSNTLPPLRFPTESDWLFEYIDGVMKSPAWDSEVMTFIDDNCVIFDNEEVGIYIYIYIGTSLDTPIPISLRSPPIILFR